MVDQTVAVNWAELPTGGYLLVDVGRWRCGVVDGAAVWLAGVAVVGHVDDDDRLVRGGCVCLRVRQCEGAAL